MKRLAFILRRDLPCKKDQLKVDIIQYVFAHTSRLVSCDRQHSCDSQSRVEFFQIMNLLMNKRDFVTHKNRDIFFSFHFLNLIHMEQRYRGRAGPFKRSQP